MISLVVAMAQDRVIGKNNGMPWHLPADLKHFKKITLGKPIIMGRKTFESIGRALPNRRNIVVSRNPDYAAPGCEMAQSLDEALALFSDQDEIFVIGGAQLFQDALPLASRLYLTFIDLTVEGDTFFPAWNPDEWTEVSRESFPADADNAYDLEFVSLVRSRDCLLSLLSSRDS
jgi:dihydrofolate reductase